MGNENAKPLLQKSPSNSEISSDDSSGGGGDPSKSKWKVHETPQDCGLIPTIAVWLWLGWNGIVLMLILCAIFIASRIRLIIIGLFSLSLMLPVNFPGKLGYKMGDWMAKGAEKYFGLKTVIEDEDDLVRHSKMNKALIFAFNPHDMLPFPVIAFNTALNRLPGKIGKECAGLMTGAIFNIPLLRHVYSWVRGLPVDKKTFLGRLHKGESFAFSPGGVQEVLMLDPKKPKEVVLYLEKRKGFIKLALQTGSPLVPVFCFGLDGSYRYYVPRGSLTEKLSRSIGFAPIFYWGRFCIPFGIPYPQKINVVIGKAIDVPKEGEKVTQESIDKYHALFIKELGALFERHKEESGYGERLLKII